MSHHKYISKFFQMVAKKFASSEGLRQCNGNTSVQENVVAYLFVLGRLFTIISDRAEQLKKRYSEAVCEVGGHRSYGLPKSVLNAYWEMKGISNILISLEVNLGSRLLDSSEVFTSLEDLASWLVVFLENYSFHDRVDSGDYGYGCLPGLDRIRKKLITVIGEANINSLRASCDEGWV